MSKTIEISRELADRLTRAYPAEITDQETMQAIRIEALSALDELRALLAAPAVERQEPVGFRYRANGDWELMEESPFADGRISHKEGGEELQPLYTSPPEPVAIPDGWKIVPLEPTEHMMKVARGLTLQQEQTPSAEYCAMVAAAPAYIDKVKEMNK